MRRARVPLRRLALVAVLSLAVVRCGDGDGDGGGRPASAPPGLVVFCFDTLRADAVDRVPALRAFAKDAVSFPDAVASASWTEPSIATMLTGLLPSRHGMQAVMNGPSVVLVPAVTTLPERLRDAGWDTAAFTGGGFMSGANGLVQGFERFEPSFDQDPAGAVERWSAARAPGKPFFLFLHTYAAHDPYGDKTGFPTGRIPRNPAAVEKAERIVAAAEARGGSFTLEEIGDFWIAYLSDVRDRVSFGDVLQKKRPDALWAGGMAWVDGGYRADPRHAEFERTLRERYVEGLGHVESIASRALAALDRARLPEGTAILVVSDHGEAFGEHGYLGHGRFLHEELVRVPMLLRAPKAKAGAARTVAGAAGLVDVTPTLLALAGLPVPTDVDGRSLLPYLAEGKPMPPRAVLAEAVRSQGRPPHGAPETVARLASARTPQGKAIVTTDGESGRLVSEEVYDLAADPTESNPLPWSALDRMPAALREAAERLRPR